MNPNDVIPPEMLSRNASNDMLLFTSMISLMVAVALIYIGKIGKQMWLVFWGVGLIIMSIYMATTILLGYDPILDRISDDISGDVSGVVSGSVSGQVKGYIQEPVSGWTVVEGNA